jgi:hypothetical protein
MIARSRAILVCGALLLAGAVRADDGPLRVRAEVSAGTLNVTQRSTLTVTAEVAEGWILVDQPFGTIAADSPLGPLRAVGAAVSSPARFGSGWTTMTWRVELAPGLPETGEIPALRFKAREVGGERFAIARTGAIPVVVGSLLGSEPEGWDPTALRPALAPLPEPVKPNIALLVGVGLIAFVGAGALAAMLVGRRRGEAWRSRARVLDSCRDELRSLDAGAPIAEVAGGAQRAVRRALAEVAGPRALAATGDGLAPMLRQGVGLSPSDAALVCDLFSRIDSALYTGSGEEQAQAGSLRDDALTAVGCVRLAAAGGAPG